MLFSYKSRTESTHKSGNVGAGGFSAGNFFERAENGFVVEGTALYYYMLAEVFCIGKLDDLVKRVFNNRVGEACGNIRNGRLFKLGSFQNYV